MRPAGRGDMPEYLRLRPRCVYAGGRPVGGIHVIPLPCETERYLVAFWHGEYYTFALKEDVLEFLRERLGHEVEVRPCAQ